MKLFPLLLAALLQDAKSVFAASPASILFLHDGSNMEVTHSRLLNNLRRRGFDLTIKSADDKALQLIEYGVLKYDNVIIFSPNADEFGGDLSPSKIANYVDNGGNLLVGLDGRVTDTVRSTVAEFGVESDTEETAVIDHFNYSTDHDEGDHTTLSYSASGFYSDSKPFQPALGKPTDKLLFQGVGLQVAKTNQLVAPIMTASKTAYSWTPNKVVTSMPMVLGQEMTLISALEAKNNARVVVSGSLKFFSDEFSDNNEAYALQLALWAFQRVGVLKLENVRHFLSENKETLETYTIFDKITYAVDVFELEADSGKWLPAKDTDLQVEFTRIDPFVRRFLTKSSGSSNASQSIDFILPDTYGVFKFIIEYKRVGYTYLQNSVTVPVRPLQHTQYERFIVSAYPYYAGAGSMLVGLFLFSFVFLYHK